MKDNYKITISCSGKELTVSPSSGAHLIENGLKGFYAAGFDVAVSPFASQSGGYFTKRRFSEREMSISFEIEAGLDSVLRRRLVSMLSPTEDCIIDVTLGDTRRRITAVPCGEPEFSCRTFGEPETVTLSFVAPTVFFESPDSISVNLRQRSGLLTFPMNFTTDAGLTAGLSLPGNEAAIHNPGDTECGAVFSLTADGGNIVYPTLSLGEKFFRCPITMHSGDVLTLDTRPRMKNITLNGQRMFSFDKRSTFFALPAGESTISVTATSGAEYADTVIRFTPLYYGV